MKSLTRVLLILSAIFIVLGGIIAAIGLFCGGSAYIGWDKKKNRFVTVENKNHIVSDKIKLEKINDIEINLDSEDIYFIPSDDDNYYIEYSFFAYGKDTVPYSVKDGKLKVKYSSDIFVFKFGLNFDDDEEDTYVKIYYPKDAKFDNIDLTLDMGSFEISKCNCKKLTAELDMGSFEAKDCYFEKADVNLDMGSLEFDSVKLGTLDAYLDMGSAELKLVKDGKKTYGYDLKVDMGDIEIDNESQGGKHKSDGDNMISVRCDMGDIEIDVTADND